MWIWGQEALVNFGICGRALDMAIRRPINLWIQEPADAQTLPHYTMIGALAPQGGAPWISRANSFPPRISRANSFYHYFFIIFHIWRIK